MDDNSRLPFGMLLLAAVYLISFFNAVTAYGDPFPLMGRLYQGRGAEALVFADGMVSLYLCIGILKRQRLTLWLLIAYNLFDICNAFVNLKLMPLQEFAGAAALPANVDQLRLETLSATLFLTLLNLYVLANQRVFSNRSPYLF